MEHVVFFEGPDGAQASRRVESLAAAVTVVEELRNDGVGGIGIFALNPVPLEFRTLYRAEVPIEAYDAVPAPAAPVVIDIAEPDVEPQVEPHVEAEPVVPHSADVVTFDTSPVDAPVEPVHSAALDAFFAASTVAPPDAAEVPIVVADEPVLVAPALSHISLVPDLAPADYFGDPIPTMQDPHIDVPSDVDVPQVAEDEGELAPVLQLHPESTHSEEASFADVADVADAEPGAEFADPHPPFSMEDHAAISVVPDGGADAATDTESAAEGAIAAPADVYDLIVPMTSLGDVAEESVAVPAKPAEETAHETAHETAPEPVAADVDTDTAGSDIAPPLEARDEDHIGELATLAAQVSEETAPDAIDEAPEATAEVAPDVPAEATDSDTVDEPAAATQLVVDGPAESDAVADDAAAPVAPPQPPTLEVLVVDDTVANLAALAAQIEAEAEAPEEVAAVTEPLPEAVASAQIDAPPAAPAADDPAPVDPAAAPAALTDDEPVVIPGEVSDIPLLPAARTVSPEAPPRREGARSLGFFAR